MSVLSHAIYEAHYFVVCRIPRVYTGITRVIKVTPERLGLKALLAVQIHFFNDNRSQPYFSQILTIMDVLHRDLRSLFTFDNNFTE